MYNEGFLDAHDNNLIVSRRFLLTNPHMEAMSRYLAMNVL
jgi:HSP90 family molecular chaperone